jgi:CelD/BcsL family acetyltransferase involved in cellulose biosynthesis
LLEGSGLTSPGSARTELIAHFPDPARWNELLARSLEDTLFLRAEFLQPAWKAIESQKPIYHTEVCDASGRLIGAGLFIKRPGGILSFVGADPGDYLDIITDSRLSSADAYQVKRMVISDVLAVAKARSIYLPHLVDVGKTPLALNDARQSFYVTAVRTMPAPSMDLTQAKIDRASFRRVENRLARQGKVEFHHWKKAEDVVPRLEGFFDLHRRRWQGTKSGEYFTHAQNRDFFVALADSLGQTPWLRYAEIRLDGRLAAAHFGFRYRDRLIWYKPAFEIELAKLSPGVAIIHRLIDAAMDEGAAELDFTIGGEAFKGRYANVERHVHDMHVSTSWWAANRLRGEMTARQWVRRIINRFSNRSLSDRC